MGFKVCLSYFILIFVFLLPPEVSCVAGVPLSLVVVGAACSTLTAGAVFTRSYSVSPPNLRSCWAVFNLSRFKSSEAPMADIEVLVLYDDINFLCGISSALLLRFDSASALLWGSRGVLGSNFYSCSLPFFDIFDVLRGPHFNLIFMMPSRRFRSVFGLIIVKTSAWLEQLASFMCCYSSTKLLKSSTCSGISGSVFSCLIRITEPLFFVAVPSNFCDAAVASSASKPSLVLIRA